MEGSTVRSSPCPSSLRQLPVQRCCLARRREFRCQVGSKPSCELGSPKGRRKTSTRHFARQPSPLHTAAASSKQGRNSVCCHPRRSARSLSLHRAGQTEGYPGTTPCALRSLPPCARSCGPRWPLDPPSAAAVHRALTAAGGAAIASRAGRRRSRSAEACLVHMDISFIAYGCSLHCTARRPTGAVAGAPRRRAQRQSGRRRAAGCSEARPARRRAPRRRRR